jgi:hypothetical protein
LTGCLCEGPPDACGITWPGAPVPWPRRAASFRALTGRLRGPGLELVRVVDRRSGRKILDRPFPVGSPSRGGASPRR